MKVEQSRLKSPAETPAAALVTEEQSHETDEEVGVVNAYKLHPFIIPLDYRYY